MTIQMTALSASPAHHAHAFELSGGRAILLIRSISTFKPGKESHMKRILILSAALTLASPTAQAQSGMDMKDMDMNKKSTGMKSMDMKGKDAGKTGTHKAVGTVKKVEATAGKVTLAHGPVQTLKWPAMTMTFTVKDKALLGRFSPDKKVEFEFVQQGSDYVITSAK